MMANTLDTHNGGVSYSIKGGNYLGGGVLGTWRRALSPKRLGPCDIHLGGWTLDLRMFGLRSILHGGWLWAQKNLLRRSVKA
jgi:hypothetical protein